MSASPEHWCRIPELENLTDLMSLEERKALSLPYSVRPDGRRVYSKCHMYDVNYTEIIDSWLEGANLSNTTDSPSLTTSPSFDSPSTRLPSPISSPDWPIIECRYGWNYDTRDYDSTLVTEVNSTFSLSPKNLPPLVPACRDDCFRRNEALEALTFRSLIVSGQRPVFTDRLNGFDIQGYPSPISVAVERHAIIFTTNNHY